MKAGKIVLVGNCQVASIADCLRAMLPDQVVVPIDWGPFTRAKGQIQDSLKDATFIVSQPRLAPGIAEEAKKSGWTGKLLRVPVLFFMGYHPDAVYAYYRGVQINGPTGGITLAIALYAWLKGVSLEDTKRLFTPTTFQRIGYFDYWKESRELLVDSASDTDLPLDGVFERWSRRGPFMHIINHPKLFALADVARGIADLLGQRPQFRNPEDILYDPLLKQMVWPLYPGVAENLGLRGDYAFRLGINALKKLGSKTLQKYEPDRTVLDLDEYLAESFHTYSALADKSLIKCTRFADKRFCQLDAVIAELSRSGSKPRSTANPYRGLASFQFWRNGVATPKCEEVDPVVQARFRISRDTKVATAGSCFAQHIARALQAGGYNYYIAEPGPDHLDSAAKTDRHYGLFSARYGNIYTTRQLLQLFERAYGHRTPLDAIWNGSDGQILDPLRPSVEPHGFADEAALEADREAHLSSVRHMFETLDVFVFTLGLTEAWERVSDGTVFPIAPGVVTDAIDPAAYRFINLDVQSVTDELNQLISNLASINPGARIILTVSPVPLVATYEKRHVLVSTTYSKAVLRVAAEAAASRHSHVAYFPSYEIVTGNHARGAYFEDDLRSVRREAVDHVMRLFFSHYGGEAATDELKSSDREMKSERAADTAPAKALRAEFETAAAVFCDEERLEEAVP